MALTQREFERLYGDLVRRIQQQATPFPHDTTEKKLARIARARGDKFFFAATYFPHYIELKEEYRNCWKDPAAQYDWVAAGFSSDHQRFFAIADELMRFNIIAGYRESAKDTLLGKIDVIHKIIFERRWFIPIICETYAKAESKVVPIKLELEQNARLRSDFGNLVGTIEWETGSFITKNGRKVSAFGREQSLRGQDNFGHRPDHIILNDIDDPTKPDSPAVVLKFIDSVKQDVLKSVNSPLWSALLLCNWTVKGNIVDELLTGKNTSHYGKHIFRALVPNRLETPEEREIAKQCARSGFVSTLKSAWEWRHPTVRLLRERQDDPDVFDAEMMMMPRNRKDQRFKDHYFRFHTKEELSRRSYVCYTGVDPTSTQTGDAKAIVTIGVGQKEDGTLHIPVMRADIQQESIDWMLETSWRHYELFRSRVIAVEENSYKDFVKREYLRLMGKKKRPLPFRPIQHTASKTERIDTLVYLVREGIMTFDLDDPDQALLIRQLKAHPNPGTLSSGGLGDDGPDALATAKQVADEGAGEIYYESIEKREMTFEAGTW
jgi:hypothetical protein